MEHHLEIMVRVPIPVVDGQPNYALGYEAMAKGEKAAKGIVKMLHEMGLAGGEQTRRIYAHEPVHQAVHKAAE